MQDGNIKIEALFNGDRIFNIPRYQRSYTWLDDNLEDFLDDLFNQRSDKNYFLGTLLFHQRDNRGEYELIDVVDGQQRLTTIMLFIKVIIDKLAALDSEHISSKTMPRYIYDGENFKLELENEDNSFLHSHILGDSLSSSFSTPSQFRLANAKRYFQNKLSSLEKSKLESAFQVLKTAEVILYIVNDISDATKIFELLNDRGRRLTNLEGVKSYLMYRLGCLKLKDVDQSINDIQDNFSSIYRNIEKNQTNENDILRYHTIAFERSRAEYYNSPEKYIKNKINLMFENEGEDRLIKEEILGYVVRLKTSYDIYKIIKNNEMESPELDELVMIGRVNPFFPQMMLVYQENQSGFQDFIASLVRFTFRATLIGLRNDNEGFYKDIRDGNQLADVFEQIIRENWWNINNRVNDVLAFRNYYKWINKNIVKFILFSYENYLREIKGYPVLTIQDYFSDDSRKKLSIEHISAQRSKSLETDEDFDVNYLHSIGNLVIDTTASNSRKGNDSIDEKMVEYQSAPIMSQNEINEVKVDWDDLNQIKNYIDARNEILVGFIKSELLI